MKGTIRIHRSIGGTGAAFRVTFVPYGGEGKKLPSPASVLSTSFSKVRAFLKMLGLGAEFIRTLFVS